MSKKTSQRTPIRLRAELFVSLVLLTTMTMVFIGILYFKLAEIEIRNAELQTDYRMVRLIQVMFEQVANSSDPDPARRPTERIREFLSTLEDDPRLQALSVWRLVPDGSLNRVIRFSPASLDDEAEDAGQNFNSHRRNVLQTGKISYLFERPPSGWMPFRARGNRLIFFAPVRYHQQGVAALQVAFILDPLQSAIDRSLRNMLLFVGLNALVFIIAMGAVLNRSLMRPVRTLLQGIRRVEEGDLEHRTTLRTRNEFATVADSFNQMSRTLSDRQERISTQLREMEDLNKQLVLRRQEVIQAEKMASLGRLSTGLAHEIGNPLGSVSGYLDILRRRLKDDDELQDMLRRCREEIDRIDRLVQGMLDYARTAPHRLQPVDAHDILRQTVAMLRERRSLREAAIEIDHRAGDARIVVDPNQFQQVLVNVILNGIQAMDGQGTIRVETARDKEELLLRVLDSGPGIDDDNLERIFDPFFTTKDVGEGTGLGLAICRRIIETFGGTVTAANRAEGGACITIRLPLAPPERGEPGP